jgi:AcrR family transcriptional regulator
MGRKDEIIAAASRLFVEKGIEKTTMEDIAKATGLQKGGLYHHVRSKADIFYQILELSLTESVKSLRKVRKGAMGPEEKFREIVEVHFKNIQKFSLEYQILLNERRYLLDEKQEKRIRAKMKAYENQFYFVFEEGMANNVFRKDFNPRVIVAGLMGVGNALYKWFSPKGPLKFNEVSDMYIQVFMDGIKDRKGSPLCQKEEK